MLYNGCWMGPTRLWESHNDVNSQRHRDQNVTSRHRHYNVILFAGMDSTICYLSSSSGNSLSQ